MSVIKRGNAEFHVDQSEVAKYLALGFDEIDDSGKVIKQATAGKSISLEEHNKIVNELKAQIAKLAKKSGAAE